MDIIVNKVDEVNLTIDCDAGIASELRDYFSFFVPGYRFTPKFKNKMWDGKIHLFGGWNQSLYVGLLDHLKIFAVSRKYSIKLNFEDFKLDIGSQELDSFIESLSITSGGKPIDIRDYQKNAILRCLAKNRQIIVSPTASGKSAIIYVIARFLQTVIPQKILIIVPTVNLVSQMYGDFEDYSKFNDWKVEENCHTISGGKDKNAPQQIYISTWQSIFKKGKDYFNQFHCVMSDEVHLATAASIKGIMEKSNLAVFRYGFTGTLKDAKSHKLLLEGLFGKASKMITTKELMDREYISKLHIKAVALGYTISERQKCKKKTYQGEIDFISAHEKRRWFIVNLVKHLPGNTLVLFRLVEKQGKPMFALAEEMITDKPIYFVSGGTKAEDREIIRSAIEDHEDSALFASYGTLSTGVNIKRLNSVVFASPSKSKIVVLQSIGRGLRKTDTKHKMTLFDVIDDLKHGKRVNYTFKHFLERMTYYQEENFKFEISRYNL